MALAELADQLGRRGEYDIWYKLASGWAHADPFATAPWQSSVGSEPHSLLMASFHFFGRMLFRAAEAKKIVLDSEQFETLARSLNNLD